MGKGFLRHSKCMRSSVWRTFHRAQHLITTAYLRTMNQMAVLVMPDLLLQSEGAGLGCPPPAGQHLDGTDGASWYHHGSALFRSILTGIHHPLAESWLQCVEDGEIQQNFTAEIKTASLNLHGPNLHLVGLQSKPNLGHVD